MTAKLELNPIPYENLVIKSPRPRREFRGDRNRTIVVDPKFTFQRLAKFNHKYTKEQQGRNNCARVFEELEPELNQFGYSFKSAESILPSQVVEPYLIPMGNRTPT
jgi:hypothetical protein